jgi:hypothetical protein
MKHLNEKLALASAALSICFVAGTAKADGVSFKDPAPAPSYFTDDSITFRYGTRFKEPDVNNGNDIEKGIVEFQHFNTDKYGSNFLDIDMLFSTGKDPVNGIGPQGATEVYAVLRRDWSFSKITGMDVSNWLITDFALHMGADANTKNDLYSPEKRLVVAGPQISFNVPVGFFWVAFDYSHEWNHNGLPSGLGGCTPRGCNEDFSPAFEIESAWTFPFEVGGSAFKFQGFFSYVAPKGKGNAFESERVGEILTRSTLFLDVGNYWGQKGKFEVGVAYEYWLNKFGADHDTNPGALANTPELVARYHF